MCPYKISIEFTSFYFNPILNNNNQNKTYFVGNKLPQSFDVLRQFFPFI